MCINRYIRLYLFVRFWHPNAIIKITVSGLDYISILDTYFILTVKLLVFEIEVKKCMLFL